jgi:hypothetical protein
MGVSLLSSPLGATIRPLHDTLIGRASEDWAQGTQWDYPDMFLGSGSPHGLVIRPRRMVKAFQFAFHTLSRTTGRYTSDLAWGVHTPLVLLRIPWHGLPTVVVLRPTDQRNVDLGS